MSTSLKSLLDMPVTWPCLPDYKQYSVIVPVIVNQKETGLFHQIHVMSTSQKEAIKLAKRHIRKQLTQSFKMVKVYE